MNVYPSNAATVRAQTAFGILSNCARQRQLFAAGRAHAEAIRVAFCFLAIPIVGTLASPVRSARDIAFGAEHIIVEDALLADDYAARRFTAHVFPHFAVSLRLHPQPEPPR